MHRTIFVVIFLNGAKHIFILYLVITGSWEAAALATRPSLDLRVNSLKATPEKVLKELSKTKLQSFSWFRQALRVAPIEKFDRHPNVQVEPAFQKGTLKYRI